MSIPKCIRRMTKIQEKLLEFLDSETNSEEDFPQSLINLLIYDNKHELSLFLHLLLSISNNNHRNNLFFFKIEQILENLKNDIKKNFSNSEIFNIFKSNKRILLILLEKNIIFFDKYNIKQILRNKYLISLYPQYFAPEIQPFIDENWFPTYLYNEIKKELPEDFYEKRKIGENDSFICKLIQNDSIKDFIIFINKNNYSFNSTIPFSIYETNNFLLQQTAKKITLIEYAAFYGSIQIFNYLKINNAELKKSLWNHAIHSENPEIIHSLEEINIEPEDKSYKECIIESIKCHHNNITKYLQENYLFNNSENNFIDLCIYCLKYYNFMIMDDAFINESSFYYVCKYDYYLFAETLLMETNVDINKIENSI